MIYPEIGELVAGILKRRKHIYLCTNGMFTRKKLHLSSSRPALHVQRPPRRPARDARQGRRARGRVRLAAIDGIIAAKEAGFLVCTNTTIFKDTDLNEIDALFAYLSKLGVDGFLVAPAYGYDRGASRPTRRARPRSS